VLVTKDNTERCFVDWYNWAEQLADPTGITFTVYDKLFNQLYTVNLNLADSKLETGKYFYDYIFSTVGIYYVEWLAMLEGTPSVVREQVNVQFAPSTP
jgi:hypothetical protein